MPSRSPRAGELPRQVYIETTNRCNSRCQTCVRTFHPLEPARDLSLDELAILLAGQALQAEQIILHDQCWNQIIHLCDYKFLLAYYYVAL